MLFISSFISRFRRPETEPGSPDELDRAYGDVNFAHLKPGSMNVTEIGIYDPDLMRIAISKFIEKQPGIIESVRLATYQNPSGTTYLMVQDEYTSEPSHWFCLAPLKNSG